MTKDMMVKAVSEFFSKHNVKRMDLVTYKSFGKDVPVKDYLLRRGFGSWSRFLNVVEKRYPVSITPVKVEKPKAAPKVKKEAKVKVEKKDVEE